MVGAGSLPKPPSRLHAAPTLLGLVVHQGWLCPSPSGAAVRLTLPRVTWGRAGGQEGSGSAGRPRVGPPERSGAQPEPEEKEEHGGRGGAPNPGPEPPLVSGRPG